ncbi:MAG: NAD-dependent epimerase/dehydratase family protein [Selenomonadaceae bacterium]|nr:NAD-dependent epimerase/dehydratase family protein [Selenomonadaceae bacterium]
MKKTILVTGAAGFIAGNFIMRLLKESPFEKIVGVDNLNDYYDRRLKNFRLEQILKAADNNWIFYRGDLADKNFINEIFNLHRPEYVINLAAQPGVRNSIDNPDAYIRSNILGFFNVLEACRNFPVAHLVYASSSSIYGSNKKIPFATDDKTDEPASLYAATKKSNELLAHCYSHLYNIPATGLRFFTVYGPAGRPDMAYFKFTNKLLRGEDIQIFNFGNCARDFTFVADIVEALCRVIDSPPKNSPPHKVYNLGRGEPVNLLEFVTILQEELVRAGVLPADYDFDAHKKLVPAQPGDVPITFADTRDFERDFNFRPRTDLRTGLRSFASWYKNFYFNN